MRRGENIFASVSFLWCPHEILVRECHEVQGSRLHVLSLLNPFLERWLLRNTPSPAAQNAVLMRKPALIDMSQCLE